jgi:hypothetical protein
VTAWGQSPGEIEFRNKPLPAMLTTPPEVLAIIRKIESQELQKEQLVAEIENVFHAGMYARTCRLPANGFWVGVQIKISTLVIVSGGCCVFSDRWYRIEDYQVIQASAGRKQMYATFRPTEITMIFPTNAVTVEEAENEFTDEAMNLQSRRVCQE